MKAFELAGLADVEDKLPSRNGTNGQIVVEVERLVIGSMIVDPNYQSTPTECREEDIKVAPVDKDITHDTRSVKLRESIIDFQI